MPMTHPTAKRTTLFVAAGIVWSIVGLALMMVSVLWLITSEPLSGAISILTGAAIGVLIHRIGFLNLVDRNIERIYALAPEKDRICIFAFQAWKSYLIILVMIGMGYTLRHLPIPRLYLSPIYLAIGLALFLSSLRYYGHKARLQ